MLNELSSSTELDISYEGCIIAAGLQAGPLYLECRPYFLVSNLTLSDLCNKTLPKRQENMNQFTKLCFSPVNLA